VRAGDGPDLAYGGTGADAISGGNGPDRLYGGSNDDTVSGGDGDDRIAGNKGDDTVSGGNGNDSLFGGFGADLVSGGDGNDVLHALAADGQPDVLDCGRGYDTAYVLRAERQTTKVIGCERLYLVVDLTPDEAEGENSVADAEADG
jgi:Ca2+-binding RTX toxin-like protein